MATAIAVPSEELSFETQISQVRCEIETRFRELNNCLRERERELLDELEEILNTFERERDKHKHSIAELEAGLKFANENFKSNDLKELSDSIIHQLTEKRQKFESEFDCKRISVEFDNTLLGLTRTAGELRVANPPILESTPSVRDYKGRVSPLFSIGGTAGGTEGQFYRPHGVAVHSLTGNIFVADQFNHRVQVFDKDGKYLYKFRDSDGTAKMEFPVYIAFYQNKAFVSQYFGHCVLVYYLNGTFIRQIGTHGNGEGEYDFPRGVAINQSNGDIYVCDDGNNRIQVFSKDFLFKSQFGQGMLKSPTDIVLTSECIYVLSYSNPFLYCFDFELTQLQSNILNSISKHLECPYAFCIDGTDNFIISDYKQNALIIFSPKGDVVHRITDSIQEPVGVTLDGRGKKIILVGYNHRLLAF